MQVDPLVVAAVAVRTVEVEGIAGKSLVFLGKEHLGEPLLVQIAHLEGHEAKLDRAVGTNPEHVVTGAGQTHLLLADQPVGDRADAALGVADEVWLLLLGFEQDAAKLVEQRAVLLLEPEGLVVARLILLHEVRQRIVDQVDVDLHVEIAGELQSVAHRLRLAGAAHEQPVEAHRQLVGAIAAAGLGQRCLDQLERAAALHVVVVVLPQPVEPDRDLAQARVDQLVDLLVEQQPVGGDIHVEAAVADTGDELVEVAVQQRLTAIEPDIADAKLLAIVDELRADLPGQLRSVHEVSSVTACATTKIAVRRQAQEDLVRGRAHQLVADLRHGEMGAAQALLDHLGGRVERRALQRRLDAPIDLVAVRHGVLSSVLGLFFAGRVQSSPAGAAARCGAGRVSPGKSPSRVLR